jgi:hypothetical protein
VLLPDFNRLFEEGRRAESVYGPVTLSTHEVGRLFLTTGRVVACDPVVSADTEPYTVTLPPGGHPVVLSVAHFEDGDRRVAGVMLRVGEGRPVSWEMALLPGEDAAELGEGEVFGYGVDSSTGCLMDEEAARVLVDRTREDEDFFALVAAEMEKTYVDTCSWANILLDPAGLNVVIFSAGFGEGPYASYFGRDERGQVTRLVTDFAIFEHEELAGTDTDT